MKESCCVRPLKPELHKAEKRRGGGGVSGSLIWLIELSPKKNVESLRSRRAKEQIDPNYRKLPPPYPICCCSVLNDCNFRVSIENDAFSNVSVFKSFHV